MKRLKIKMVRMNLEKGEGELESYIAINDSYFIKCYEVFREKEFKEDEIVDGIIKVVLTEEKGLDELKEGIKFEGKKYYEIVTTPSGMKEEENIDGVDYKMESIFICEDYIKDSKKDFREEFENSLSGGIIKGLEGKEICINKMITSKKALAMTGADFVKGMPNILFVDEFTYKYERFYSYFNKDNKLEQKNIVRDYILNDGGGLMCPSYADKIKDTLGLKYNVEFAIIRGYKGLAIKGVLVNFDFAKYMKSQYIKDTDTFQRKGNKYYIKDYFGAWRDIDKVECIINKSQAKYLGEYKDRVKIGFEWESVIENIYKDSKYKAVNDGLYISKVNKDPRELLNRIILNYQVLQNLNISAKDLIEIAKVTIEEYKNVIKLDDVNYVKLALGDWKTDIDTSSTITNKLDLVIDRFGEDTLEWDYIRTTLKKQLTKRINKLAGGKIPVNGQVCIGALCPATFCNFITTGERGSNGLKVNEFYQGGNVGKRLSYRNPIAYYAEITKINLVENNLLEGYTPELLFVNGYDDFLFIKSGADLDGDLFGIVEDESLLSGVIEEEAPFININDGKVEEHKFTRHQMYEDTLKASGNLIGEIAINNSRLCAEVTGYDALINKEGKVATYTKIKEAWLKYNGRAIDEYKFRKNNGYFKDKYEYDMYNEDYETSWDEYNSIVKKKWDNYRKESTRLFKEYCKEEGILRVKEFTEDEQKDIRERLFKKYKEDFFKILLASQIAIDMPKTLISMEKWLKKDINKLKKLEKPRFFHNLGKCNCKGKGDTSKCTSILNKVSNNVMDEYCNYIDKELLEPLDNLDKEKSKERDKSFIRKILGASNAEVNERLKEIFEENKRLRNANGGNTEELNRIDIDTSNKLNVLGLLEKEVVCSTIVKLKRSMRFCFNFLFDDYFLPELKKMESKTADLVLDSNGDYKWNGKRFKAVKSENLKEIEIISNLEENIKRLTKVGELRKVRFFKNYYTEDDISKEIKITNFKCDLGEMYDKDKNLDLANGVFEISNHFQIAKNGRSITVWVKVGK